MDDSREILLSNYCLNISGLRKNTHGVNGDVLCIIPIMNSSIISIVVIVIWEKSKEFGNFSENWKFLTFVGFSFLVWRKNEK